MNLNNDRSTFNFINLHPCVAVRVQPSGTKRNPPVVVHPGAACTLGRLAGCSLPADCLLCSCEILTLFGGQRQSTRHNKTDKQKQKLNVASHGMLWYPQIVGDGSAEAPGRWLRVVDCSSGWWTGISSGKTGLGEPTCWHMWRRKWLQQLCKTGLWGGSQYRDVFIIIGPQERHVAAQLLLRVSWFFLQLLSSTT